MGPLSPIGGKKVGMVRVASFLSCPLPTNNTVSDFVLPDGYLILGLSGYFLNTNKIPYHLGKSWEILPS